MSAYRICPDCGAALDPGERCDCWGKSQTLGNLPSANCDCGGKSQTLANLGRTKGKAASKAGTRKAAREVSKHQKTSLAVYQTAAEPSSDYYVRSLRGAIISQVSNFTVEDCEALLRFLKGRAGA